MALKVPQRHSHPGDLEVGSGAVAAMIGRDHAAACGQQGARQDAVAAAAEVLPALEGGVTSMRCLNRLRIVRQAAGNTTGAQEFCGRFDALERTLAASYGLPFEDMPDARAAIPALLHDMGHLVPAPPVVLTPGRPRHT
jgi:hypothetical protein